MNELTHDDARLCVESSGMSDENTEMAEKRQVNQTAWGDHVTDGRKSKLDTFAASQRNWAARAVDSRGVSPLKGKKLDGADVFYLAKRALAGPDGNPEHYDSRLRHELLVNLSDLHLEGADLSEANLKGAALRMAHLEGVNLHEADLVGADLRLANLQGANLSWARLENSNLRLARLESTNLSQCWFDSKSLLNGVYFDSKTQLGDIQWGGVGAVNLTQIDWEKVQRLGDERAVAFHKAAREHEAVVRAYRQVAAQLRAQGMSDVADRFAYRAQIRQRYTYLRTLVEDLYRPWRWPGDIIRYLGSSALALLAGYGYRPGRTIILYVVFITLFATTYFAFSSGCAISNPLDMLFFLVQQIPHSHVCAAHPMSWNEAFVVSFTAFHGRGFLATNIKPSDPQATIAAAEAVLGLIIEISFIATFTQRFFGSK